MPRPQPAASYEVEPNNTYTEAMEIPMGVLTGNLARDNEDYYKFGVPHGHILKLAFTPNEEGESMVLDLKNLERKDVWYSGRVTPGVTKSFKIPGVAMPTYFIKVYGGRGEYTIEIK